MEEEVKNETATNQPEVVADEVVPVTVCTNCNDSGKYCLVCSSPEVI